MKNYESFSEQLQETRCYDKLKLLWQHKFNDKHIIASFVRCLNIKTPELYCLCDKAEHLPILDKCVIKPTKGAFCKNVFLIKNGINAFDNKPINREQLIEQISVPIWKGSKPQFICEEYLDDEFGYDIPIDYKFYIFGGDKIAIIHQIKRINAHEYISAFYDEYLDPVEDIRLIKNEKEIERYQERKRGIEPLCFHQMKEEVLRISNLIGIFCRVDMYATTKGSYFGEITFYPSNGINFSAPISKLLTDSWKKHPCKYPEIPFIF